MSDQDAEALRRRRATYHTLAIVALALTAGRISVVTGRDNLTAFLSANDRSRWCTVASLVEHGTYAIDKQIAIVDPVKRHIHPWQTIDKVRHVDAEGKQRYYSSKPPLFPTAIAGVYKVVNLGTGMTLTDQPIYVSRIVLALVNLPLLALFFYATLGCIERVGRGDWSKRIAAMGCCFGTMLLPFSISLNNHLPAATATAVAMWVYLIASQRKSSEEPESESRENASRLVSPWMWGLAGVSAALAAANELPALSMTVFWFGLFAWLDRRSILPFIAGIAIVAVAFFGTNWIAHHSLRPPYAHRGNGAIIAELPGQEDSPDDRVLAEASRALTDAAIADATSELSLNSSDEAGRWIVRLDERQYALLKTESGWDLRHWDDWYEYPGTYWKDGQRRGVDKGEASRITYFAQMTVGHHGIFSLTPLWILMPLGLIAGVASGSSDYRRLALAILVATTVCFLFYLNRPLIDRNYGGVSICFRWLLWFAPLWLVVSVPVMEWFRSGVVRRGFLYALLAMSVFSMSASLETPWQSPWIYQFWLFLGWIGV
ncbi:MAG: hypothetical protein ACR2NZ_04090 [Rubripirellula sp.]